MKMLTTLWDLLIPFISGFFCLYLVGSFISVSFDPSQWTETLRIVMCIQGAALGLALWVNFMIRGHYERTNI